MAAHAIEENALAGIVARNAVDPFGVRQLRREVLGLAELEIERGGFLRRDFDVLVIIDIVKSNKDTEKKVLWIVAVVFLPVLGPILYYFLGRK